MLYRSIQYRSIQMPAAVWISFAGGSGTSAKAMHSKQYRGLMEYQCMSSIWAGDGAQCSGRGACVLSASSLRATQGTCLQDSLCVSGQ